MKNKNNRDRILKYLSGQMTKKEKTNFIEELNSSTDLNFEFQKIRNDLGNFISDTHIKVETDYWSTMPSEIDSSDSKTKRISLIPRLSFAIPVLILFLILLLGKDSYSPSNLVDDKNISALIFSLDNNSFNEFYSKNLLYDEIIEAYSINDKIAELYINDIELNNSIETYQSTDDYEYLEQIDETELNNIYQNLLEEKIL
ncbi:MAG: hypothetical protein JXA68_03580 [Ignavibacteriales bacterium]|nr:hypothetical protein [Ignavibacteriales bacterium]